MASGWAGATESARRSHDYCNRLEQGEILFFSEPPFPLNPRDLEFLTFQHVSLSSIHKNVSFHPASCTLNGFPAPKSARVTMQRIMQEFSDAVIRFISDFLRPYGKDVIVDYASFRPLEEKGRKLPLHKRNDLLHVDAFPSRPTHGGRILRVFVNIHPHLPRVWNTTIRFPELAATYAVRAGLGDIAASGTSISRRAQHVLHEIGLPVPDRSPYDSFMLQFHNYLKENEEFQLGCPKFRDEFPSHSAWLVFTDGVPHAVLSGQFALEQTFIVPMEALVATEHAPIRILERLCGKSLALIEPLKRAA